MSLVSNVSRTSSLPEPYKGILSFYRSHQYSLHSIVQVLTRREYRISRNFDTFPPKLKIVFTLTVWYRPEVSSMFILYSKERFPSDVHDTLRCQFKIQVDQSPTPVIEDPLLRPPRYPNHSHVHMSYLSVWFVNSYLTYRVKPHTRTHTQHLLSTLRHYLVMFIRP